MSCFFPSEESLVAIFSPVFPAIVLPFAQPDFASDAHEPRGPLKWSLRAAEYLPRTHRALQFERVCRQSRLHGRGTYTGRRPGLHRFSVSLQLVYGASSSAHAKVEPSLVDAKEKVTVESGAGPFGPLDMCVFGPTSTVHPCTRSFPASAVQRLP